jgi:hypothetical protein
MLRDGGDRDVEALSQLLHRFFSVGEEIYQASAVWIGYGVKDAVARGSMHGVNDIKAFT